MFIRTIGNGMCNLANVQDIYHNTAAMKVIAIFGPDNSSYLFSGTNEECQEYIDKLFRQLKSAKKTIEVP